jgi:hypothetical protein
MIEESCRNLNCIARCAVLGSFRLRCSFTAFPNTGTFPGSHQPSLLPQLLSAFFIFESTYNFTSDCYGENSSSAIAGQGLMRNTLGGVAPLFASQFFHNLRSQYASLLLAIFGTLLTFIPFVMFKYGHVLRGRSKLASSQLRGDEHKDKTRLYPAAFV